MPITKGAKKTLKSSENKRIYNLRTTRTMKSVLKDIQELVSDKKTAEAEKMMPAAYKAIDKAAKNGIIKKNTAGRKKSRLSGLIKRNK